MIERSIHILQMGKHFLYLPIYFAERKDFFGFLPPGVTVVIDAPVYEHTDAATYRQMMDESPRYRDFEIAITDPIQILQTPLNAKRKPAVLAALVTNAAFWAVNHGRRETAVFRDLGRFDRVIAYAPGTTSYNIATRIARDSGVKKPLSDFIRVVEPGGELLLLNSSDEGKGAVALSPDILEIEGMGAAIELALGETQEYGNVLVAALVSHNQFVAENEVVVRGIVKGIQKALLMTRSLDAEVIRFAKSHFHHAEKAEAAVQSAIRTGVFPLSVAIAQPVWESSAKASCEAEYGIPWSDIEQKKAGQYYRECVQPYEAIAEGAIRSVLITKEVTPRPQWRAVLEPSLIFAAIGVTALFGWLPALIVSSGIIASWWVVRVIKHTKMVRLGTIVGLVVVGLALIALPFVKGSTLKPDVFIPLGVSFLVPALLEFLNYAEQPRA